MFIRQCYRTKNGKRHAYWALPNIRVQRKVDVPSTSGPPAANPMPRALLGQFPKSLVNEVVTSSRRTVGQTTESARAIDKKRGHAIRGGYVSSFNGVSPTQIEADRIIAQTLSSPTRTFYGNRVIDVYNSAGQGVRFNSSTKKFMGFIEGMLATQ